MLEGGLKWMTLVLKNLKPKAEGFAKLNDASESILTVDDPIIITDPPYFDNIAYADVSDYFYIWHKRILNDIYPDLFKTILTPKQREITALSHRFNNSKIDAEKHFLNGLSKAAKLIAKGKIIFPYYTIMLISRLKQKLLVNLLLQVGRPF